LFVTLPARERKLLFSRMTLKRFRAGGCLIKRGTMGEDLFILAEGEANVLRRHRNGHAVVVKRLRVGELFGELAFITGAARTADVEAHGECCAWRISRKSFAAIKHKTPEFLFGLLTMLATRLTSTTQRLAQVTLLDLPSRILLYIEELNRLGAPLPSQADIGRELGARRESVNRALRELEELGEIGREGRRFVIKGKR
jgi:CRP/FNR family cyclic AMP-dependent transcriptional regulator